MDEKVTSHPKDMDESAPSTSYLQVLHEMHPVVVLLSCGVLYTTFFLYVNYSEFPSDFSFIHFSAMFCILTILQRKNYHG